MRSNKLAGQKIKVSTQKYLDIAEIRNDTVVLKDGTLRAVLLVSSINFALKSEDEQEAIISAYVSFLNYLDFSLQIVIQSRKLNIDPYLQSLKEQEAKQTNELLRAQIADYRNFIVQLVELGDIMSKQFYVVVPYSPVSQQGQKKFWDRVMAIFSAGKIVKLKQEKFAKYKDMLDKRVEFVMSSLASIGLNSVRLDTQSLIELYYNTYNPDTYEQEKLQNVDELRIVK